MLRWRKKKEAKKVKKEFNVQQKIDNVKMLIKSGRPMEAIAYIYLMYTDLMTSEFDNPRLPYQTIREYAIVCVNELNQKPDNIYPFVSKIESIIYGGVEPTPNEFKFAIDLFSNLYLEITGRTFPGINL